jgi:hypothetical protein
LSRAVLAAFGFVALAALTVRAQSPAPAVSPASPQGAGPSGAPASVSPVPTPSQGPAESAQRPLEPSEAKQLLKDFAKAQKLELKALAHRQSFELKELKASQKARESEWLEKEKAARHKFFAENAKGPARRAYIQDFRDRWKALRQIFGDERAQRAHEHEIRYKSVQEDQESRLKELQGYLERRERPPQRLWPDARH